MMAGFSKGAVVLEAFFNGHSHAKMVKYEHTFARVRA